MLRSLKNKVIVDQAFAPQTIAASALSAAMDLKGKRNFAFLIHVGSFAFTGVNKLTCTIHESDDNVTYAASGNAAEILVLDTQATQENKVHELEYKGSKRYVKLDVVEAGTVTAPFAVSGICTEPEVQPA